MAGGYGTRLRPHTKTFNKHLLPVYDQPMIFYPADTLKKSGIKDIFVVTESASLDQFKNHLGDGSQWGVKFTYGKQTGAGGIAAALSLAKHFANGDSVAVILGDNLFEQNFKRTISGFHLGATIFLKKVKGNLQSFGVPVFDDKKIIAIEEKPRNPKSPYAVTGFYIFDGSFFKKINNIKKSVRGELEITDLVNEYLKEGQLRHEKVKGHWADMGTNSSLLAAGNWVAKNSQKDV